MAIVPFDILLNDSKIKEYVTDKRLSAKSYMKYMLMRLLKMFKYENLPDTIPHEMLEYYLLMNGTAFITKVDGSLYAFYGGFGGEGDVYYRPTRYTVANPALRHSGYHIIEDPAATSMNDAQFSVGEDGVLVRNDPLWFGLAPMLSRYATMFAENLLTIRTADVMLRAIAMISAPDDKTRISAETYIRKLEKGELSVVGESPFFDGIKMQSPPSNNGSYLTQFIELQQYLKGSFYNEIGLNANFNMKREAIGKGESSLNEDSLLPLCQSMLQCRQEDMEKVSSMFGLSPAITVEFDSAWEQNIRQMDAELESLEKAAESADESANEVSRLTETDSEGSEEDARGDESSVSEDDVSGD